MRFPLKKLYQRVRKTFRGISAHFSYIPPGAEILSTSGTLNPDKWFYIIWRKPPGNGFFSNFLGVIGHLLIADRLGYTPIVDMLNYKTYYNQPEGIDGLHNEWEYYFEQPSGYSISAIANSKNIV